METTCFNIKISASLFGKQDWLKTDNQIEVLTLIQEHNGEQN